MNAKILVADDSLTIQKVIRLALSGDGYDISTVSDGDECLEQVSLIHPDVCIIDISLPKRDAYELRALFLEKPDLKNIPVVMMSSTFEKLDEDRYQTLGFSGHLIKPFDPAHLRTTLSSVLGSREHVPDAIETAVADSEFDSNAELEIEPTLPASPNISAAEMQSVFQDLPPLELEQNFASTPDVNDQNMVTYWDDTKALQNFPEESNPVADGFSLTERLSLDPEPIFNSDSGTGPAHDPIKALTEDTVKLAGGDRAEWGIVEPGKSPFAKKKTTAAGAASGTASTTATAAGSADFHNQIQENASSTRLTFDDLNNDLSTLAPSGAAQSAPVSHADMESIVRDEVRRSLREIAERIIREELDRLLSNPPKPT